MTLHTYVTNNIHYTLKSMDYDRALSILFNDNLVMVLPLTDTFNTTIAPFKDLLHFKMTSIEYNDYRFTVKKVSGGGVYIYVHDYTENTVTTHYITSRKLLLENLDMLYPELININEKDQLVNVKYDISKYDFVYTMLGGTCGIIFDKIFIPLWDDGLSFNDILTLLQMKINNDNRELTISDGFMIGISSHRGYDYLYIKTGETKLISFKIGKVKTFNARLIVSYRNNIIMTGPRSVESITSHLQKIKRYHYYVSKLKPIGTVIKPRRKKEKALQELNLDSLTVLPNATGYTYIVGQLYFRLGSEYRFDIKAYIIMINSRLIALLRREVSKILILMYNMKIEPHGSGLKLTVVHNVTGKIDTYSIKNPKVIINQISKKEFFPEPKNEKQNLIQVTFKTMEKTIDLHFSSLIDLIEFYTLQRIIQESQQFKLSCIDSNCTVNTIKHDHSITIVFTCKTFVDGKPTKDYHWILNSKDLFLEYENFIDLLKTTIVNSIPKSKV